MNNKFNYIKICICIYLIKEFNIKKNIIIDHFKYIEFRNIDYLADLPNATFGTTIESYEDKLLALEEIPWEEVAFPTVKLTLKFYQDDLSKNTFTFREDQILLS